MLFSILRNNYINIHNIEKLYIPNNNAQVPQLL